MASRDHWRGKQCLKGFYIWLSRFGGAHRQPRSFSAIMTFLIGGILLRDTTPIYYHSASYAREHGELDQFRASYRANIFCKEVIEQAVADHYRNNRLDQTCVRQVLQQFNHERIFYVLANTIRQKETDGRISQDNKAWAKIIPVCEDRDSFGMDRNCYFVIDHTHPGLIDLFLTQIRREYIQTQEKTSILSSLQQKPEQPTASGEKLKNKKEPIR